MLSVRNLSYWSSEGGPSCSTGTPTAQQFSRRILKGVSLRIDAGELCAVLGPSGSGKTTLLKVLSKRARVGSWMGTIRYGNGIMRGESMSASDTSNMNHLDLLISRRQVVYVPQEVVLTSSLTVEETLYYATWAYWGRQVSASERKDRVDQILETMGLLHVRSTLVGDASSKTLSGGQMKRLMIAAEIVKMPKILVLDEPTSGLDSSLALEVMIFVRKIASLDRCCLCSIHQPSQDIFLLFDKVAILAMGRLLYFGAAGDILAYFSLPELGYKDLHLCKNTVEAIMEICGGQQIPEGSGSPRQPKELEFLFKRSRYYQTVEIEGIGGPSSDSTVATLDNENYYREIWVQLCMLLERTWLSRIRDTATLRSQLIRSLCVAFLFGIPFYGKGDVSSPFYDHGKLKSQPYGLTTFLFTFTVTTMLINTQSISFVSSRIRVYRAETESHMYCTFSYWIAELFTSFPLHFLNHSVMAIIAYLMVQLNNNADTFFYFLFVGFFGNLLALTLAYGIAAATRNEETALLIFSALFIMVTIFAGFPIKINDIPVYWRWCSYIDMARWVYEGQMVNIWTQYDTDDYSGDFENGSGDILEDYQFDGFNKDNVLWIVLVYFFIFAIGFYYGLLPQPTRLRKLVEDDVQKGNSISNSKLNLPGLKAPLLKNGVFKDSVVESEDADINDELEVVKHVPRLTVASYASALPTVDFASGCKLSFHDVSCTATHQITGEKVVVLKNVSGKVLPGEMTAIMGGSGSGKSSLIDLLAQRKTVGHITGEIFYNGRSEIDSMAYIMQNDHHIDMLTVEETLQFAASLRLKNTMSDDEKKSRVDKVLHMLLLDRVKHSLVGNIDSRGISGGELRRLTIAVEIIHLPNLLLLDEPTTGLDSYTAYEVMCGLRNLANQKRTVVVSIHQPSREVFELFDSLLLLAEGRVIYFGPVASVVQYFTSSPYQFGWSDQGNPAEFALGVSASSLPANDGRIITATELASFYESSDICHAYKAELRTPSNTSSITFEDSGDYQSARYASLYDLRVLLARRLLVIRKQPMTIVRSIIRDVIIAFFFGSVYWQLDSGDSCNDDCYNRRFAVLYYSLLSMLVGHTDVISAIHKERELFYRERGAGAYNTLTYSLSIWLPMLPILVVNSMCFCVVIYPMAGLRAGASHFITFMFFILMANYVAKLLAYVIAVISEKTQVALNYFPIAVGFNYLYAGFLIFLPSLPVWQRVWLPYLSFLRFCFQGVVLNEIQHNDDLPDTHYYINMLGFDFISIGGCAAILLIFFAVFVVLLYVFLRYINFERR